MNLRHEKFKNYSSDRSLKMEQSGNYAVKPYEVLCRAAMP
jgi:hypothetical protein